MAWRIDEHVIRGEIDNRDRGRVVGKIWFTGRGEPVELRLAGNCWRDLAGRRLEFVNKEPKPGLPEDFGQTQDGVVGDITASRKVKVPDVPLGDLHLYYKTGREMPWHWGNSLHLEWHSESNGRVLIESASFELKIVGEPTWEMSEAEEEAQRVANGEAMLRFLERFDDAMTGERTRDTDDAHYEVEAVEGAPDDMDDAWRPLTEAEADEIDARNELLNDRIQARLDREGDGADLEQIIEEEIERLRRERGEPDVPAEDFFVDDWPENSAFAPDEIMDAARLDGRPGWKHPLVERAKKLTLHLLHEPANRGWIKESDPEEHPLAELISAVIKAAGKLTSALNGRAWPPPLEFCASAIVRLKKAHAYLEDALAAHDDCVMQHLAEAAWLAEVRLEVNAIFEEAEKLIAEIRARLKDAGAE